MFKHNKNFDSYADNARHFDQYEILTRIYARHARGLLLEIMTFISTIIWPKTSQAKSPEPKYVRK